MGPVSVVVRPGTKRISLRFDHALRQAQLVLPHRRFAGQGRKLITQKSGWLSKQWQQLPKPMPFIPGGKVLLGGEEVVLVFEPGRGRFRQTEQELVVPALRKELFAGRVRQALIDLARTALQDAVAQYGRQLNSQPGKITVRDTRSRWGSCSAAGNLNFSWRLICAPAFVLSYVAAHEVAHIRHAHHGPKFWDAVDTSYGDPAIAKKYLRENAPKLFAVGAMI